MHFIILGLCAYLAGSLPFGFVFTKIFTGKKLHEVGSKNIGASNTFRAAGKGAAAFTLFFDALKGYLVAVGGVMVGWPFLASFMVILGHMFPVWLRFKGGRGVATLLGILAAFSVHLAILAAVTWAGFIVITRTPALASLLTVGTTVLTIWFWSINLTITFPQLLVLCAMIILKHQSHIVRLLSRKTRNTTDSNKKGKNIS